MKVKIIAEKIDELADLCELWARNRASGRTPGYTGMMIEMLAKEITDLCEKAELDVPEVKTVQDDVVEVKV